MVRKTEAAISSWAAAVISWVIMEAMAGPRACREGISHRFNPTFRIIPPVAICVFIVRNITGVPFNIIYKGVLPFLLALVAAALLLFLFPEIALFLPNMFMGS